MSAAGPRRSQRRNSSAPKSSTTRVCSASRGVLVCSEDGGIDLEAEIAVITGDLPMGASTLQCAGAIRLLMLVNDVSLRHLIPGELAKGFGFFQSKPASAFSPLAVTPDELGDAWRDLL